MPDAAVLDPSKMDKRTKEYKEWKAANPDIVETTTAGAPVSATASPTDGYMDPAQFFGPVMASLLASRACEAHHLLTFAKKAWQDYKMLVDWARSGGL